MFRSKRNPLIEVTRLSSLVATNVEIRGDVVFSGGLRVDGRIEGNVLGSDGAHGLLVVSENGSVKGNVRIYDAVINGTIEGDIEVEHFLELQAGSRVTGNISYRQLQMDCGARVAGRLERLADASEGTATNVVEMKPAPRGAASAT